MGGLGVPGGGIANLAPGMSPGMGGRFPTMGTPTPPMTQQQMRQVLLDQQRTQQIPQMPGGQFGMPGGQMVPTQSMFGSMVGQQQQAQTALPQAVARPGGVPPNTPPAGMGLGAIFGGMK